MGTMVQTFEEVALPHLDAAYNLARWLTRNERDAEDVAQEAYLRAFQHFRSFHGGDARPWLLTIVRNTYYTWLRHNRAPEVRTSFEDGIYAEMPDTSDPEMLLVREADKQMLRRALEKLPDDFREVIVLREFEELSYKQIADVVQIPLGTVMSRLARARKRLEELLANSRDDKRTEQLAVAGL